MSSIARKYVVLVCVDGPAASDAAVEWATRDAVVRHLPITLLHTVPGFFGWVLPGRTDRH